MLAGLRFWSRPRSAFILFIGNLGPFFPNLSVGMSGRIFEPISTPKGGIEAKGETVRKIGLMPVESDGLMMDESWGER